MNRRNFLAGMATTAIASSLGSVAGLAQGRKILSSPKKAYQAPEYESLKTDVLVVGAGASGVSAAIAAARQGAKVILIEEDYVPGGAPVDMFVAMPCGGPQLGIYKEMIKNIANLYRAQGYPIQNPKEIRYGWYLPAYYIQVIRSMIAQEPNLQLICGAQAVKVKTIVKGNRTQVQGVYIRHAAGVEQFIEAAVTIDATGTGLVSELAGCKTMYGREAKGDFNEPIGPDKADHRVQRCTWMYIAQRLNPDARFSLEELKGLTMFVKSYEPTAHKESFKDYGPTMFLNWGATVQCEDTRDPVKLGKAQMEAMDIIENHMAILMEKGFAVHLAPKLGVRECRRVLGEHVITVNDMFSKTMPEDVIAYDDYYLDSWGETMPKEYQQKPRSGIPYRALIAKDFEGLLLAGRIISGTHLSASSYRVQPIAASIGQGAGTAAAMAVLNKTQIRDISISELKASLKKQGTLV